MTDFKMCFVVYLIHFQTFWSPDAFVLKKAHLEYQNIFISVNYIYFQYV